MHYLCIGLKKHSTISQTAIALLFPFANAIKAICLISLCCSFFYTRAHASVSTARVEDGDGTTTVRFFFPISDSQLRQDCLDNATQFDILDEIIANRGVDAITAVEIVAMSSPEGRRDQNLKLAEGRAESMKAYLLGHYPALADLISVRSGISAWPADGATDETTLSTLRFSEITFRFRPEEAPAVTFVDGHATSEPSPAPAELSLDIEDDNTVIITDEIPALEIEPVTVVIPEYRSAETCKYPVTVAAIGTNLLYDALTVYNVELEIPIWDRFSILVEDIYPWWETGFKYCLQMWEMGGELRWWLKPWDVRSDDKLRGFFVGAYGMSSKYDFQWDTAVDYQGEYWSAGAVGGWATAIGRSKKFRLEFSLGIGYLYSDWRHYLPTDSYDKLIRDRNRSGYVTFFGPTRAKVSLTFPIDINFKARRTAHE